MLRISTEHNIAIRDALERALAGMDLGELRGQRARVGALDADEQPRAVGRLAELVGETLAQASLNAELEVHAPSNAVLAPVAADLFPFLHVLRREALVVVVTACKDRCDAAPGPQALASASGPEVELPNFRDWCLRLACSVFILEASRGFAVVKAVAAPALRVSYLALLMRRSRAALDHGTSRGQLHPSSRLRAFADVAAAVASVLRRSPT
mmetsp:Transcript_33143/g.104846  ORF Transcript_33143/g.104846 Transcript_33143/m.104846 type:complete len:211 (-) Transcript_33143:930-1562(-)